MSSDRQTIEEHRLIIKKLNSEVGSKPSYELLFRYYSECHYLLEDCPDERELAFKVSGFVKAWCDRLWQTEDDDFYKLYWDMMLFEAQNRVLDSYFLYLEKNREPNEKFYEPKRENLLKIGIIQALQDMLDDKIDILSISLPPGTGKTTLSKFFVSGVIGWFPKDFNLFFSHNNDIARMYYDGVCDIVTNPQEYTWNEIFTKSKVTSQNAKLQQLNIDKYKPFPSLQCTSRSSNNAGLVRASKFLLVDDLVAGIEEALNVKFLDKLWSIYTVDARQRKTMASDAKPCKEIHIATRWSVHDVIGRLQREYGENGRCRFIAVPDIDEETGESNFNYKFNGFSTDFFKDQERLMDEISYRCLYKNEPVERDGILFPEQSLRRYFGLPEGQPDEIIGQCDTKGKGTDYFVLPALYRYGDDYYMVDCVCNNSSDYESQYENSANLIVRNGMQSCDFERNSGGDRVAMEVSRRVEDKGHLCNITDTPTETNKEAKIYQCSSWIMQHILFKDKSMYDTRSDYGVFMSLLSTYSVNGKKQLDDVPDCLATFAARITKKFKTNSLEVAQNPFWGAR